MLRGKNILLIISGGIAAYKALDLLRQLKKEGAKIRCILTQGGSQFITPMSVAALSEQEVHMDLWSLKDETEMGHIRLSREADLILVAPASANLIAQMAYGLAEDLASTTLLAANCPVMIAPAMNPMMWENAATQTNIQTLKERGIQTIGPNIGDMACGETGQGRMSEPDDILQAVIAHFQKDKPLAGKTALVTSGPTHEPIDPVRYISNRSSGKQGHAIAQALADAGASVTLVSGPVSLPTPKGIETIQVQTAQEMLEACENALPTNIAICAAAVADWRIQIPHHKKMKKEKDSGPPTFTFVENPDILHKISSHPTERPTLVVGFAAETENLEQNAKEKLSRKKCDWVVANNVGQEEIFGAEENHVYLVTHSDIQEWPRASKESIARDLVTEITNYFLNNEQERQKIG